MSLLFDHLTLLPEQRLLIPNFTAPPPTAAPTVATTTADQQPEQPQAEQPQQPQDQSQYQHPRWTFQPASVEAANNPLMAYNDQIEQHLRRTIEESRRRRHR